MSQEPIPGLHRLAAQITTAYARANPIPVESLAGVIQSTYQALLTCATPRPATPEKPVRQTVRTGRRGRPRKVA